VFTVLAISRQSEVCVCVCVCVLKDKLAVLCLKLNYSEMFAGNQYRSD